RRAMLRLRKTRALKPELVLRVANWERKVVTLSLSQAVADLFASSDSAKNEARQERIPRLPGIYLFRDSTGYLYIGEAANLRTRLTTHLTESDRPGLADYLGRVGGLNQDREESLTGVKRQQISVELHIFAKDSPAKKVAIRRAYESELIRSRRPTLNVRP
ncbi:MAG: GIY-YIG nuclease family protein, partial [Planctomycetota bacterium]